MAGSLSGLRWRSFDESAAAITVENRAGVLHAVMRDPPRNALGEALIEALAAVVEEFERGEAKVLVLSSALPEFFATGAEVLGEPGVSLEQLADYRDRIRPLLERLRRAAGRRSPRSTAAHSGPDSSSRWRARCGSVRGRLAWPCLVSTSDGFRPPAGRSAPALVGRGQSDSS